MQAGPLRGARCALADEGGAVGDAGGADADAVPAQELGRAAQRHREETLTAQPKQVGKIQYNLLCSTYALFGEVSVLPLSVNEGGRGNDVITARVPQ